MNVTILSRRAKGRRDVSRVCPSVLLVCLLTVLLASTAPAEDLQTLLRNTRYTHEQLSALEVFFSSAEREGLPVDGLHSRLAEGIAKNVPAQRVLDALGADADNLRLAREIIRSVPGTDAILQEPSAWERAGNLLRAGWTPEELAELVRACAARPVIFRQASLLFIAVTDWGVAATDALELTRALAGSSTDPEDFPRIAAMLGAARNRRIAPEQAVDIMTSALRDGRTLRQIEGLLGR